MPLARAVQFGDISMIDIGEEDGCIEAGGEEDAVSLGCIEGDADGVTLGDTDGDEVGAIDGTYEGYSLRVTDGTGVVSALGLLVLPIRDGKCEDVMLGEKVGLLVAVIDGEIDGLIFSSVGLDEGTRIESDEGALVGLIVALSALGLLLWSIEGEDESIELGKFDGIPS
jgi:hypothetical protein